jgi:hypothetical protein
MSLSEYNFIVVDSLLVTSKSTRPPGQSDPESGSAPGASGPFAWRNMSLRHVPLRGTGWSRNPSVSGCKPFRPQGKPYEFRIRPSEAGIKG